MAQSSLAYSKLPGLPLQGAYSNLKLNKTLGGKESARVTPQQMKKIDQAAEDFEAQFLSQMMEPMFDDISLDPMAEDNSEANDIYKSMMIDQYGKLMAKTGGVGLADTVKRQLLTLQEVE